MNRSVIAGSVLLLEHEGDRAGTIASARAALEPARATTSGFKSHAMLGLVGARDAGLVDEMNRIVTSI